MKKIICYVLCVSFILPVLSSLWVYADNTQVDMSVRQHILNLPSETTVSGYYSEKMIYDDNNNIIGRIVTTPTEKLKYTYTYNSDGTFVETTESLENEFSTSLYNNETTLFADDDPDRLITSPELISQIKEYQAAWEQADKSSDMSQQEKKLIKDEVHIQAQLARADYCIMYPNSDFAKSFLPDGRMNAPINAFRRVIDSTIKNDYSTDVMVLQRLLFLYGYLDEGDILSSEYGYYNEATQDAVKEYTKKELNYETTVVNKAVIAKLFSSSNEWQTSKRNYENLRGIGLFNAKHNFVCLSLALQLQSSGTVYREGFLYGAGVNHTGGRFDVACNTGLTKYVWEVKPDTAYGHSQRSLAQLLSYIRASKDQINISKHPEYCPLTAGFDIRERVLPWSKTESIYYSSDPTHNILQKGMVFYRTLKKDKPILVPDEIEEFATDKEHDKEYSKITFPEPEPVREGLIANNVNYTTLMVVGGLCIIVAVFAGQYWAVLFAV